MKVIIIIFSIIIFSSITFVSGEEFDVRILEGSSIEGCEKSNSCLSPSELTILKGDTVNWIREEDVSHFIQSYTNSQLNWATQDYSHIFKKAGTYQYTVSDMPWIQGIINVKYTEDQNDIPNNFKITNVEKIGKNLHLEYEGHMNTPSAVVAIYTTDDNQHVGDIQFGSDELGYFSDTWVDPDDSYHEWVDGSYHVEFWSVDGDNGNKKSEIFETDFSLRLSESSELHITENSVLPEWVRNVFVWYAQEQISEKELLGAIEFLINSGIISVVQSQTHNCVGNAACIPGIVTKITDGDTIQVHGKSIRFALSSTPELNDVGGIQAKQFLENICPIGSHVTVDEDDKQTKGSYGRIIAVVYCNDLNLNKEILIAGHGMINTDFCSKSEFTNTSWAKQHGC